MPTILRVKTCRENRSRVIGEIVYLGLDFVGWVLADKCYRFVRFNSSLMSWCIRLDQRFD